MTLPAQEAAGRGRHQLVRVLEEDPELLAGVDQAARPEAVRDAVARVITIPTGPWRPSTEAPDRFSAYIGLLVLDGLLSRNVHLDQIACPELVGVGDLLRPWQDPGAVASMPFEATWTIIEPTRIAVLDGRFTAVACRWPSVITNLMERAVQRTRWLSFQVAIAHLQRVDSRLILLFWHLADRWGRVHPDGVVVPIRMTHALLAQLIGAQRPSVTAALKDLSHDGYVVRQSDGTWLLSATPPDIKDVLARRQPTRPRAAADG